MLGFSLPEVRDLWIVFRNGSDKRDHRKIDLFGIFKTELANRIDEWLIMLVFSEQKKTQLDGGVAEWLIVFFQTGSERGRIVEC